MACPIFCASSIVSIPPQTVVSEASFEVSLRLHLRIFRPARNGVQAERSEFIEEPGRRPQPALDTLRQAKGDPTSTRL